MFLIALALGLAAFATMIAADRRRVALGEVDAITRKYGRLLVTGASIPATPERPSVQVDSMRSLVRIAHLHEQLIVHSNNPSGDRFVVLTETGAFSYRAAPAGRSPPRIRPGRGLIQPDSRPIETPTPLPDPKRPTCRDWPPRSGGPHHER